IVLKNRDFKSTTFDTGNLLTKSTWTSPNSSSSTNSKIKCSEGFVQPYCDECGLHFAQPNLKIVGGQEAKPHSWPSIVMIKFNYKFSVIFSNQIFDYNYATSCGGTLLNRDTILTAAHCIVTHAMYSFEGRLINFKVKPNQFYETYESMYTNFRFSYHTSPIRASTDIALTHSKNFPVYKCFETIEIR
ncbi:chymotrypsin-like elastase family member 2A, partial [Brachionus plicatilis]